MVLHEKVWSGIEVRENSTRYIWARLKKPVQFKFEIVIK